MFAPAADTCWRVSSRPGHVMCNDCSCEFNFPANKCAMSSTRPRRHEPLPLDGVTLMHVRTIGSKGAGELQFHTPRSVCETISGNIAVADIHNNHEPSLHMTCSGLENTRQQVSAVGENTPPAAAYDTRSLQNHFQARERTLGGVGVRVRAANEHP